MPALDPTQVSSFEIPDHLDRYDARDAILYALGTGAGLSVEHDELHWLYEAPLEPLPTMALVLGTAGFWPMSPRSGLDWLQILHGTQSLRLFRPLEIGTGYLGKTRVVQFADKGEGKPALIRSIRTLATESGIPVAEMEEVWVVRDAGGFGGERRLDELPIPQVPDRAPDGVIALPTALNQAFLYRLTGDRNPLHADHAMARQAGFERPILHGLATMGNIGRALIHGCCEGVASRLTTISQRFVAPVYPGETIRTSFWRDGCSIRFEAHAAERAVLVVDNGMATIDEFPAP